MMTSEEKISRLSPPEREALHEHLLGGTSANWLSDTLTKAGCKISPTSLKRYRKKLRDG